MNLGNSKYNQLYNPEEKHYISYSNNVDMSDKNSSHIIILDYIEKGSKVLDVGCSFGYLGEWLAQNKNCNMYGIDIDTKAINFVKSSNIYKDAYYINLDNLENEDSKDKVIFDNLDEDFDYIICADLLEHLKDPTYILKLLSKKLKFDGEIIVSVPNISNIDILVNLLEGRFNYGPFGIMDNTHLRFFTKKSFIEWIASINVNSKEYKLDLSTIGEVHVIPESTQELKKDYENLINGLLRINPNLKVLQNLFAIKKVHKSQKEQSLIEMLKRYRKDNKIVEVEASPSKPSLPLNSVNGYEFNFLNKEDDLCGIIILPATYGKTLSCKFLVEIFEENSNIPVMQNIMNITKVVDNKWLSIEFNRMQGVKDKNIRIKIIPIQCSDSLSIWMNDRNSPCLKLSYYKDDFNIQNSIEENPYLEKLDNIFKRDNILSKCNINSDLNVEEILDENRRLRSLIKDLLDEVR